ncbi:MAG: hypothetical protein R3C62_10305 [Chloroflexota bacterium]
MSINQPNQTAVCQCPALSLQSGTHWQRPGEVGSAVGNDCAVVGNDC